MSASQEASLVASQDGVDGGGAAAGEGQQQQNMWTMLKGFAFRLILIYFVSSLFRGYRGPPQTAENGVTPEGARSVPSANLFGQGMMFDMFAYLSENELEVEFANNSPVWQLNDLVYGDWSAGPSKDGSFSKLIEFSCSESVYNNGSIYLHVYVVKAGSSPDPTNVGYEKKFAIHHSKRLNKYRKKKYTRTQNLLTGKTEATEEDQLKADTIQQEILSHWHPNLTLNVVYDQTAWTKGSLPPPLDEYVRFDPLSGGYYPIFFFNDYWNLAADYTPINRTVKTLSLQLTYAPMSLFKWQMYASQTMKNKWTQMLGSDAGDSDDDQDSLKQAILETNSYILGLTIVVSILHTVFELMAFKNDIQFWRSRKSLEGLSVRSVLFNVFTTVIVLLYILDNDANFVVKVSLALGLLIELWKIPKVVDVSLDRENKLFGLFPRIRFEDKGSYVESSTKEYDTLAFKYLSWILFPLLGGYVIYSLIYAEHRGWYSFILSMLYGFLLTFGFIMMTPQLFINYKLKSVAHLPWRMLTYKFLNTFIDDIFAFVIRMPTLYRIGCFRDDIVFLIYVYQRYIYRVDPTRVNEFGTTGEDLAGEVTEGGTKQNALTDGTATPADNADVEEQSPIDITNKSSEDELDGLRKRKPSLSTDEQNAS